MMDSVDTDLKIDRRDVLKRFLIIFLPVALAIGVIIVLVYHVDTRAEKKVIKVKETAFLDLEKASMLKTLHSAMSDLLVQAEDHDLMEFSETGDKRRLKVVEQRII